MREKENKIEGNQREREKEEIERKKRESEREREGWGTRIIKELKVGEDKVNKTCRKTD